MVHRYVWLDNNTAILYDPSKPLKERDFKVLDPKKSNVLTPLFNVKKAVESLNEILDEYLFLINDIRKDELEDIIVNQFESI